MAPPENPNGAGPAAPSDPAQPQPQPPAKSKWKKKDEKKDDDLVSVPPRPFPGAQRPMGGRSRFGTSVFRLLDSIRGFVLTVFFGGQSEEDLALKEQLELYVVRAQDADPGVQKLALESMRCCSLAEIN
jgi:26S proteasome regulatory subunit N1